MLDHARNLIARLRARPAAEQGFTLIELLVAVAIGMIVLLGVLNLVDSSGRAGTRVADRSETVQRLRIGMERISRVLRTQVCMDSATPPIVSADNDSIVFYSDTSTTSDTDFRPRRIRLTFSTTGTGSVLQEVWNSTNTTPNTVTPVWTFPALTVAPASKTVLLSDVGRIGSTAVLRYYGFGSTPTAMTTPLNTSLTADPMPANSITKVVRVDVALEARPQSRNTELRRRASLTTSTYNRNADFGTTESSSTAAWGPKCF